MNRTDRSRVIAVVVAVVMGGAVNTTAAQQPPPIQGVTGTIATEETVEQTSKGGHNIFVKAARLLHLNRRSTDGSDAATDEVLRGLKKGTAVGVHYTSDGENLTAEQIDRLGSDGLKQMEGVIMAVNRTDRTISIKLADGTRQTLQLSDRAAGEVGQNVDRGGDSTAKVIVYFRDEAGKRVAHYFKRVS
jgi:hypothetical protein